MKIVILSEYFHPDNSGGTPTDLSDLSRALRLRYPEILIDVITSKNLYRPAGGVGPLPRYERWAGLDIKRLRVPKSNRPSLLMRFFFGGVFTVAALTELLQRKRYDLVFIVTNPPALGLAAWFYFKITGTRYLYLVHDLYPNIAIALGKLRAEALPVRVFKAVQRRWLHDAGQVVVLGRCMKRRLVEAYGLDQARVTVIPSWGVVSTSGPVPATTEFRSRLAFTGTVALYAGNFSEYAKIDLFLKAAGLLRARNDLLFVLVGDGTRRAAIEQEITVSQLSNVRLLPKVPREMMAQVLAGCDVALISLDQRMLGLGVPSKLYTILAAGCPILAVVPAESEVALVVEEEKCGINVTDGSPAKIAAELEAMADAPARLKFFSGNSRRALERKYTMAHACDRFRVVINNCVAGPTVETKME